MDKKLIEHALTLIKEFKKKRREDIQSLRDSEIKILAPKYIDRLSAENDGMQDAIEILEKVISGEL